MENTQQPTKQFSVWKAILLGHMIVNLPALTIMFVNIAIGLALAYILADIFPSMSDWGFLAVLAGFLLIGFILGWMWWSFIVPRWRRWVLQKGTPKDELQRWGVLTGLVWPKGSFFEKTEFSLEE